MADSIDSVISRSEAGDKSKRKNKQEGLDTPEKCEARIRLYMSRVWVNPDAEKEDLEVRTGENGNPLNIFTGEEYTDEEVHGTDEGEVEE